MLRRAAAIAAWAVLAALVCVASDGQPRVDLGRATAPAVAPFDLGRIVDQVHFAFRPDGAAFTAGHGTHQVRVDQGALELTPVHHPRREARPTPPPPVIGTPVRFGPARVTLGGASLLDSGDAAHVTDRGHLARGDGAVAETLRNSAEGVEQSWRFERAPRGRGALTVTLALEAGRFVEAGEGGLHFEAGPLGVRYGHGTWIDAQGERTPVPARFERGQVRLEVPEAVLSRSRFPAVLDPLIAAEVRVDTPVSGPAPSYQSQPAVASDGTDWLVVWEDFRGATADIFGARVSSAGAVLDPTGILINNGPGVQWNPAVVWAGTAGAPYYFVAWEDDRAGLGNADIYGARVNGTSGLVLDTNGVAVSIATLAQVLPALAFDGTNVLIVWADNRNGSPSGFDVYGAYYTPATNVFPYGAAVGIPISTATLDQYEPQVAYDKNASAPGYLVVWHDYRAGSTNPNIYGARLNLSGTVLDTPTATGGLAISTAANLQTYPAVASNGTDWLVAWQDYRSGTSFDVYAARVTSAGSVTDSAGVAVNTNAFTQQDVAVAWDGTNYLVAWSDFRNSATTSWDVYAARVSSAASVLDGPVATGGVPLSTAANPQTLPAIAVSSSTTLVVWQDERNQLVDDVFGTRVADGTSLTLTDGPPASGGVLVSTGMNNELVPAVSFNGTNYLVAWQDDRLSGTSDLYGVRVSPTGTVLDPSGILISGAPGNQRAPVVDALGGTWFVAWYDDRFVNFDVYAARVAADGGVLDLAGSDGGIVVAGGVGDQWHPGISCGASSCLVVWDEMRTSAGASDTDVYGARFDLDGGRLDPAGGFACTVPAVATGQQQKPKAAWNGTGWLVAWEDQRNGTASDIYAERVTPAGTLVDGANIPVTTAANNQRHPQVSSNGTDFLVLWDDDRTTPATPDIYGARVSAAGGVIDPSGLAVSTATGIQQSPQAVFDGTDYAVVWEDHRGGNADVYGARLTPAAGTLRDGAASTGGIGISTAGADELQPSLGTAGKRFGLVAYSALDSSPSVGSSRVRTRVVAFDDPPSTVGFDAGTLEDTPVALTLTATDPEGDPLTFRIVAPPLHGVLDGGGPGFVYVPNLNDNGLDSFTFVANDGTLDSPNTTVNLWVTPVNDPPVFTVQDVIVRENSGPRTVDVTNVGPGGGPDEQSQTVGFTVTSSLTSVVPTPTMARLGPTLTLAFTPVANAVGVATITVTAQDTGGTANGGVDTTVKTFTVTVTNSNVPPTFDPLPPLAILEDSPPQVVDVTGVDPGGGAAEAGQSVTVWATSSDAGIVPDPAVTGSGATRTLTFTPGLDRNGKVTLRVWARDDGGTANGGQDTFFRDFDVNITAVNDPPTLSQPVNPVKVPKNATDYTVPLFDVGPGGGPDEAGQSLTVTAASDHHEIIPDPSIDHAGGNWVLHFAPVTNAKGHATVMVTAQDDGGTAFGGKDTTTISFAVEVSAVNNRPQAVPAEHTCSGPRLDFVLQGLDADPTDTLTFRVTTNPAHGSVECHGDAGDQCTYVPKPGYAGTDALQFTAFDGTDTSDPAQVTIDVNPTFGPLRSRYAMSCGCSSDPGTAGPMLALALGTWLARRRRTSPGARDALRGRPRQSA